MAAYRQSAKRLDQIIARKQGKLRAVLFVDGDCAYSSVPCLRRIALKDPTFLTHMHTVYSHSPNCLPADIRELQAQGADSYRGWLSVVLAMGEWKDAADTTLALLVSEITLLEIAASMEL